MTLTYWGYHLIFTLPLIFALFWWVRHRIRRAHVVCWLVTLAIVFIATTPWDNYAAAIGIWGFGEGVSLWYPFASAAGHTLFLGHIPFEEYAFFGIQATLVILLGIRFLPEPPRRESASGS